MVSTRAQIISCGQGAEIERVNRANLDPVQIQRDATKRRRLLDGPEHGQKRKGNRTDKPSKRPRLNSRPSAAKRNRSAAQQEARLPPSTSAPGQLDVRREVAAKIPEQNNREVQTSPTLSRTPNLPPAITDALREYQQHKTYRARLQARRQELREKLEVIWQALDWMRDRQNETPGEEQHAAEVDDEVRARKRFARLGVVSAEIRKILFEVDRKMESICQRLVDFIAEIHGRSSLPSSFDSSQFQIPEERPEPSGGEDSISELFLDEAPASKKRKLRSWTALGSDYWRSSDISPRADVPDRQEMMVPENFGAAANWRALGPRDDHQSNPADLFEGNHPEPAQFSQHPQPAANTDAIDPAYQTPESSEDLRERQWRAFDARRMARRNFQAENERFDAFWVSYDRCKERYQPQPNDSRSEFDRQWRVQGQYQTQDLILAEQDYGRAAIDCKRLGVELLSENQSSIFPSDDSLDQAHMEAVWEKALKLDRSRISAWIQEEWQHAVPAAFDDPEARPILHADVDVSQLPHVPYAWATEEVAANRRRARIDEWNLWRGTDWEIMLREWADRSSNRQGVAVSPPPEKSKPDPLRLEGGKREESLVGRSSRWTVDF